MSPRLALLAAVLADLAATPLAPPLSVHTGALPPSVDLKAGAAAVLGDDTEAEAVAFVSKTAATREVVLTARVYADTPAALSDARAAADALCTRWRAAAASAMPVAGYTVAQSRIALLRPLPQGDPASSVRGEIVSVRFTLIAS